MSGIGAFIHPAAQTVALALGLFVLILGLRIRRERRAGPGPGTAGLGTARLAGRAALAGRHMRLARWFIALLSVGYPLGLAGMWFALEKPLFGTAHSYFATLALGLFLGVAYLGRRLRIDPGRDDFRQIHTFCAFIAMFVALAVAILGFQLLP